MIDERVRDLAAARQEVVNLKEEIAGLEQEFFSSPAGLRLDALKQQLLAINAAAVWMEHDIRQMAVDSGEKRPHPAVNVKIFTVLDYTIDAALDYCRQHLPNALRLNASAFEKVAKVAGLDFVIVSAEPRATIARDLSQYVDPTDRDE